MTDSTQSRLSSPALIVTSLAFALGLTAFKDSEAHAGRPSAVTTARTTQTYDATDLRILDWTLWYVAKYYVEPERIDPHKMTVAGLEGLEKSIPQVLVEPLGGVRAPKVRVRVGTAEQEFVIGDVEALWAVGTHIREVFRFVMRHSNLGEDEQRAAEYAIVEGVLGTLDPHTNLLRPEDFETMRTNTKGSFGGLGIEVGIRNAQITVTRVLDGNPAAKAGVETNDHIVQIDGQSTVTMNLSEAVEQMRGEPGTVVTLYVRREGSDKIKKIPITRDIITLDSIQGEVLPGTDANGNAVKVGLVQLNRNFAQTTGKELRAKLAEFEKAGVRGVILDMRDNPGGLLTAAVEVADAFLSSGTIVSTVGTSSPREELTANSRYDFPDLPVVVLIDQGSASATEIVAGALRNLGRAVLLGRRTFGKGSVQVLHDRKVGDKELALKLTIAQYLTPGDVSIQSVGVSPDLETIPVMITKDYTAFHGRKRFDLVREESLSAHLTSTKADPSHQIAAGPLFFYGNVDDSDDENDSETKAPRRLRRTTKTADDKSGRPMAEVLLEDPEIRMARDLVVWAPSSAREDILAKIDTFVAQQTAIEDKRIHASLQKRGIDWSPGPASAAKPNLRLSLTSDKPNHTIAAGDSGTVTLTVANDGTVPAFQVRAFSESDYSYFDERELLFGRIDPGQTKTATLKLTVAEHELSRTDRFDWQLFSQDGEVNLAATSQTILDVSSQGLPRPAFAYGFQVLDDPRMGANIRGNADGALQVGERVRVRMYFTNTGEGRAIDTWVTLRNLVGESVYLHSGRENVKAVPAGESRVVEFDMEVKKPPETGEVKLQLSVADAKIGASLSEKFSFPLAASTITFAGGSGHVTATSGADLFASPIPQTLQKVARAEPGSTFKVLGTADGWVRVELDAKRFAFVRATDVKQSGAGKPKITEFLAVSPPKISLADTVTQTETESIQIRGVATDDEAVRDVYITVYNPARNLFGTHEKVFYQAAPNPSAGRLEFSANVPLTPGNNFIEVRVREDDDVIATKQMWVLRTSGLQEARANANKFVSNGKLSVDTLSK